MFGLLILLISTMSGRDSLPKMPRWIDLNTRLRSQGTDVSKARGAVQDGPLYPAQRV